ncbi:MAG: hypothetical protein AAGG51_05100 [Cyanobacteria bacterium P01_G01_bin.54]
MKITAIRRHDPLSLATYREVQSHLKQLVGVEVELIAATDAQRPFCYADSQIESIVIQWSSRIGATLSTTVGLQVQAILDFYQLHSMDDQKE